MGIKIEENIPLSNLNTFKVGGPARFFIRIQKKEELLEAVNFAKEKKLPFFILGGGSNVLIPDSGFVGVVIKIETKGIHFSEQDGAVITESEAGELWDDLVKETVSQGMWGLENLSLIPGTVGASVIQNIGAYGTEVKDTVLSVEVFDTEDLTFKTLKNNECLFGYRDSIFKKPEGKKYIVTKVVFSLDRTENPNISYKDLKNHFDNAKYSPSLEEIRQAVIKIRVGKFPDLKQFGTAGSFFKNIILNANDFEKLASKYPDIQAFDIENGQKKVSTASILDKVCGLKGYSIDGVQLFQNQPLVVVCRLGTTSKQIKKFVAEIKQLVAKKINIDLESEVQII